MAHRYLGPLDMKPKIWSFSQTSGAAWIRSLKSGVAHRYLIFNSILDGMAREINEQSNSSYITVSWRYGAVCMNLVYECKLWENEGLHCFKIPNFQVRSFTEQSSCFHGACIYHRWAFNVNVTLGDCTANRCGVMQKCGIIRHFNKIQWQEGRTKTKRKARKERAMGKDGTDIFIIYQTVVTWKTVVIIRIVSTYFSPELWPLCAGNLHRLSGNVRLCTIKQTSHSFFLSFFLSFSSLIFYGLTCLYPLPLANIFIYKRVAVELYRRNSVW
jgi:hypothetical protein